MAIFFIQWSFELAHANCLVNSSPLQKLQKFHLWMTFEKENFQKNQRRIYGLVWRHFLSIFNIYVLRADAVRKRGVFIRAQPCVGAPDTQLSPATKTRHYIPGLLEIFFPSRFEGLSYPFFTSIAKFSCQLLNFIRQVHRCFRGYLLHPSLRNQ